MVAVNRRTTFCSRLCDRPQYFGDDAFHVEKFVSYVILSEGIRRKA